MFATCRVGLFLFAILAMAAPPTTAKENSWKVDKLLEGEDGKKSRDVSGIACTEAEGFPRSCLVIDDNRQHAQFVTVTDGELVAGKSIRLIDDTLKPKKKKPKPLELDGEGVAFSDGFYYVIGSHGRPRHISDKSKKEIAARKSASSQIVRFPPRTGLTPLPSELQPSERSLPASPPLPPRPIRSLRSAVSPSRAWQSGAGNFLPAFVDRFLISAPLSCRRPLKTCSRDERRRTGCSGYRWMDWVCATSPSIATSS